MLTVLTITLLLFAESPAKPMVVVAVGAPGADEYAPQFQEWSERWRAATEKGGAQFMLVGDAAESDGTDRDRLQKLLTDAAGDEESPLWLVMIGHGTFDGQAGKFNLRGPDIEAAELAEWLKPLKRPVAVIHCASASAPFINKLAGENRVVISATKSGDEQNFARFGQYISATISDPAADLDKDGQTSLLESYLTACRQVAEFYEQDARLATEHALLDDNGDGLGTPAEWFRGLRATQRAKDGATLDGTRAHQWHLIASDREQHMPAKLRERRDVLELKIATLRADTEQMKEDDYYRVLEPLMIELARLYESADNSQAESVPK
ncbi:MAG: hypothetical protein WD468_00595 [Pirellulales bacterium]